MNRNLQPVRVLHVLTGLSSGGAEAFIMNMYRNMDRSKVQFDFLLRSEENIYAEELKAMGSRVYTTPSFPRHFLRNAIQTAKFFKEHHYDIVHIHANALLYMRALKCAKKSGVKCRIMHSHNSAMAHMQLLPIHNTNKKRIHQLATDCFACSDVAGQWMFTDAYRVINNAIDLAAFCFSEANRAAVRKKLGICESDFAVGHTGRFVDQKNHAFLLEIFAEISKQKEHAKLLLLGDGKLRGEMEQKAKDLGIEQKVFFLGAVKDVSDYLSAMDLFVFPSVFEGLGISVIEAQANGLPILCSQAIPDEAVFDSSLVRLSLGKDAKYWAEQALNMNLQRSQVTEQIREAGFDIHHEAQKLQEFYLSKAN